MATRELFKACSLYFGFDFMQMRYVEMTDAHYDAMKQARIYKAYSFIVGGMLYAAFLKEKTFLMNNCLF